VGRMRLPCWTCGEKIMVDDRTPADGLAAAGWVLTKGETYCWRCAVQRGLRGAPATADDQSPIGVPEFLRRPVPQGQALGDPRTREALERYRRRGWLWIAAGVAAVAAMVVIGPPALPRTGEAQGWMKLWWEGMSLGLFGVLAGVAVFRRARRWRLTLASMPWRCCRSRLISVTSRRGRSGVELTACDDASPTPIVLMALSSGMRGRERALAGQSEVWIATASGGQSVIAIPGTLDLFAAAPPKGRSCRALIDAHRRGLTHVGVRRRGLRIALYGIALGAQAVWVVVALTNPRPGLDGPIPVPAGPSTARAGPVPGMWTATGTVMSDAGSSEAVGGQLVRAWSISRQCSAGSCAYYVARQTAYAPVRARLRPRGRLWYAQFSPETAPCAISDGRTLYWQNQTRFLFRFSPDGRTVTAGERNYSYAPACGYGLVTVSWAGSLVGDTGAGSGTLVPAVQTMGA
jgi:hypothetical protein